VASRPEIPCCEAALARLRVDPRFMVVYDSAVVTILRRRS